MPKIKYQYAPCYEANNIIHVLGYVTWDYDYALKEARKMRQDEIDYYGRIVTDIFVAKRPVVEWEKVSNE